jgi:hypothetical protein
MHAPSSESAPPTSSRAGSDGTRDSGSPSGARRLVEIRAYRLKPGTRADFHAAVVEQALPMVRAAGMDVVAHGPGADDEDYFLVRSFVDLPDLQAREDAFYGSGAWRDGPREAVESRIETYVDTLLWLSPASIEDLRRGNGGVDGQG